MHLLTHRRSEHLSQLDAPLIEGADAPDESLHSRSVLIDRKQLPAGVRVQLLEQQRGRWTVSREELVLLQILGNALRRQVLVVLSVSERVGLSEEVGHELVVIAHRLALAEQRVLARAETDEVAGNHASLVNQLVEAVLAVGSWLAEIHLADVERHRRSVHRHSLAVRFHVHLLDVGGEAEQRLRVGQQGATGVAGDQSPPPRSLQEAGVPHTDEAQHHRDVLLHGRGARVHVDVVRAGEELLHHLVTVVERQRQETHRRADAVAAAHPVPEAEDVLLVDAEGGGGGDVAGDGAHVVRDDLALGALVAAGEEKRPRSPQVLQQPATQRTRVQHRLGGRERLGDDDDQSALRIQMLDLATHVEGIHVRNEVELATLRRLMSHGVEAKRLIHELRTQITTADTDGNDGVQSLARASLRVRNQHNNNSEGTGADSLRKLLDTLTHLINLGNDVLAVHIDGLLSICTESSVKNCAPLGNIQFHPCHHGVLGSIRPFQPYQLLHHLCLGRESHQLLLDLRSHSLARIIQNDVPMFNRKLFKTVGILLLTPYTEAILGAESEDVFVQFEGGTLLELSTRLSPRCVA